MGSASVVSCVLARDKIGAMMLFAIAATLITLVGVFLIASLEIRIYRLEKALKWEREYSDNLEAELNACLVQRQTDKYVGYVEQRK